MYVLKLNSINHFNRIVNDQMIEKQLEAWPLASPQTGEHKFRHEIPIVQIYVPNPEAKTDSVSDSESTNYDFKEIYCDHDRTICDIDTQTQEELDNVVEQCLFEIRKNAIKPVESISITDIYKELDLVRGVDYLLDTKIKYEDDKNTNFMRYQMTRTLGKPISFQHPYTKFTSPEGPRDVRFTFVVPIFYAERTFLKRFLENMEHRMIWLHFDIHFCIIQENFFGNLPQAAEADDEVQNNNILFRETQELLNLLYNFRYKYFGEEGSDHKKNMKIHQFKFPDKKFSQTGAFLDF